MYKVFFRLVVFCVVLLGSCQKSNQNGASIEGQSFLLGTPLVIQIFEGGSQELIDDIFYEVEKIERMMSTSRKDYSSTEIMDINEESKKIHRSETGSYKISQDVAIVLKKALEVAKVTNGAFDPSIQPLVALWGFGSDKDQYVPTKQVIERILPLVNWKTLSVDMHSRRFMMKGQQGIDVSGIAKGYAANIARKKLVDGGVSSALIDFGGNIVVVGSKTNDKPWRIGIQEPFSEMGTPLVTIDTKDTSVVTSGIYERNFIEEDEIYSHLIDIKTGYPVKNTLTSVTIITNDSMFADGLSTGIFILGIEEGKRLAEELDGVEAIFITDDKKIYTTSGVKNLNFKNRNEEYVVVDSLM